MAATILCVSCSGQKLGAAYYEETTAEVKLLHDTAEDTNYFLLKSLINEAKPTQVIVNKSQDKSFLKEVCTLCNFSLAADNNFPIDESSALSKSHLGESILHRESAGEGSTPAPSRKEDILPYSVARTEKVFEAIRNQGVDGEVHQQRQGSSNWGDDTGSVASASEIIARALSENSVPKFNPNLHAAICADDTTTGGFDETINNNGNEPLARKKVATEYSKDNNEVNGSSPGGEDNKNDGEEGEFFAVVSFFPNFAYSFSEAKKRLEKVFTDNVRDAKLLTAFRFDFTAFNMIRAFGALLRFLDQQRVGVVFEEYEVKTPIKMIRTINLNDLLEVDSTTMKALEIFHSDYNPASIRKKFVFGNARKEGASLFNLCNICRSTPGRQMLRYWFECPTTNRDVLNCRHEAISFFYHDCNLDAARFLRNLLKDIMSVRAIIGRMNAGNVSIADWKNTYVTLCALAKIGEYLSERDIKLKIIADKMSYFGDELVRLANVFIEMIDFRESLNESRFVINRGIDEKLDDLKESYEQLPEMLTNIAQAEAEELGIESCSVAYVPIIGYLLVIPETYNIHGSAMIQLVFSADGMCHYKSRRMQRLDEQIGDIKMQIIDMETTITLRLQAMVVKRGTTILRAVEAAAVLDAVLAMSAIAREYNWIRPKFVAENIVDVSMGRHPISELLCKNANYVPNPILSNVHNGKVQILSGPNASGKSVYLKMVGVIVYLAHVGSFVPADKAIIGPINRIMSRIYTVDSVLDGMSSFANDLKQVSNAIRRSDGSSLLIIDEFGKGTMTEVGLSLLASCLNYWLEKEPLDECPHILLSSHFHALRNLIHNSALVVYRTLDVIRAHDDTLEFQFRLVDGVIDNSFAAVTALKMGIPAHVVQRSDEIYEHLRVGASLAELKLADEEEEQRNAELAAKMEEIMDRFRDWDMESDPRGFLSLYDEHMRSWTKPVFVAEESASRSANAGDELEKNSTTESHEGVVVEGEGPAENVSCDGSVEL